MRFQYSVFLFCLFISNMLMSQRFQGGLRLAGTLSQIDGDDIYGFNKPGYEVAGFVAASLSTRTAIEMGIQYNVRGSLSDKNDVLRVSIGLHYIDIPILFIFKDWLIQDPAGDYYRMEFFGGSSIGRLISSNSYSGIHKDFKQTDVSWILGASYFWSKNWGGAAKYTRSISSLYQYSKNGGIIDLTGYYLSLGLKYKFN